MNWLSEWFNDSLIKTVSIKFQFFKLFNKKKNIHSLILNNNNKKNINAHVLSLFM